MSTATTRTSTAPTRTRRRRASPAPVRHTVLGLDVVATVASVSDLGVPAGHPWREPAADALAQHHPVYVVRDPDGLPALLVTNPRG